MSKVLSKSTKKVANTKDSEVYGSSVFHFDPDKSCTYVNVTILDASEAVYVAAHAKVTESVTKKTPKFFSRKAGAKVADKVAKSMSEKVPTSKIATALSKKTPKKLMYNMFKKTGMRLSAECVFVEDNYFVMQIQVQKVDSLFIVREMKAKLAKEQERELQIKNGVEEEEEEVADDVSATTVELDDWIAEQEQLTEEELNSPYVTESMTAGKEKSWKEITSFKEFVILLVEYLILNVFPVWYHKIWQEKRLPILVNKKIGSMVKESLDKKMESKLLKADTHTMAEAEQARFLFAYLRVLRAKRQNMELAHEGAAV